MKKKMTAIGLTAGLIAGAGAGLILELSGTAGASGASVSATGDTTASEDTTTDDSTANDDSGTSDAAPDHGARITEILQPLVDDGTLTQAQLDAVVAALEAAGPMGGGHGGGRGGFGLDVVAETLGLTADEVRAAIQGGQTIADLAAANGSSAQAVIDALLADITAHLAEEVAAGEHTQEEADAKLADATTRITEFVNNTSTAPMGGGMGGGMGDGGPGGRGHHGDAGTDTATDTASTGTGTIDAGPSDTNG